jgi:hypothetical protein
MWNSKPKKSGHDCSKRRRGRPKLGRGVCHPEWRAAVRERIEGKRLVRRLMRDPDEE